MFAISIFNVFSPEADKLQLSALRGVRGPGHPRLGRSFCLYQGLILVSVRLYNANPVPGITCNHTQAHFSQTFERSSKGITTLARSNVVNIHNSSF